MNLDALGVGDLGHRIKMLPLLLTVPYKCLGSSTV